MQGVLYILNDVSYIDKIYFFKHFKYFCRILIFIKLVMYLYILLYFLHRMASLTALK